MAILFQFGVVLILSKTITCWLTQSDVGCNLDCHHGSCHWFGSHMRCICSPGYYGDRCHLECNRDCHNGHCQQDTHHRMYCACNQGWQGERCDQADHCASKPCQNGGDCHEKSDITRGYECKCHQHYTGDNCEVAPATSAHESIPTTTPSMTTPTSPTTTPTPITTTTTTPKPTTTTQTTSVPSFTTTCSKFVTVLDMAEKVIETSILATPCSSGNHSSHEAFVINICHPITPLTWKQGYNVMQYCDKIPAYTPIASFESGKYSSADSRSGIFIGCLHGPDGFKAAFQRCDEVAVIESIMVGESMFNNNPYNYFTLES